MTEALVGIGMVAFAFMAVAWVQIRAGCGADCGACERPCKLTESSHEEHDGS